MKFALVIGALLNITGCLSIIVSMFIKVPYGFPQIPEARAINPPDYVLFRLFTAGTALCFGSMYIYLYLQPQYIIPILFFGMALKYWAFFVSLIAYYYYKLPKTVLANFGLSNLIVAILFSILLLNQ